MSDTIEKEVPLNPSAEDLAMPEIKAPTPEEIQTAKDAAEKLAKETAAKALADKIAARVAELKSNEGKTFKPKCPNPRFPSQTIKVERYVGVAHGAHLFKVESKNPGHRWTPPATRFLDENEEITSETETATPEII